MKKLASKISSWLFIGLLLFFGGVYLWLFYTNSGLNWSLQKINQATNGILEYSSVTGAWLTNIEFDHLNIDASPVFIRSENPQFEISIKKILSGTLEVVAFHAAQLTVRNQPEPSETTQGKPGNGKFALPVTILVHSLSVDKFSYQEEDQTPLDFVNVKGGDSRIHNKINIGRVSARTSYGNATAKGTIVPVRNGKMDLDTEFVLNATADTPEIKGSVKLGGTINELTFYSKIIQPYEIDVDAKLDSTQPVSTWSLKATATSVPLQANFQQAPLTLANLSINASGNFSHYSVDGVTHITVVDKGEWDANWSASKNTDQWTIENLDLFNKATDTTFNAKGTILTGYSFTASTPFTLQANWQNAQWPLIDTAVVASKIGTLSALGNLNDYQLAATGAFRWSNKEVTNIDINGQGSFNKLELSKITGDYYSGHIDGSGSVDIGTDTDWKADAKLTAIDLSGFFSETKTRLNAQVGIDGAYQQDKFNGSFLITGLKGTVNEQPVEGKGRITVNDADILVTGLSLRSGKNHLRGKLEYLSEVATRPTRINADWDLNVQDLSLLHTTAKGKINSKGSISGELEKLSGKATLHATGIIFEDYKINKLNIDTGFDLTNKTNSHVQMTAEEALLSGVPLNLVQVNINGKLSHHSINAKIVEAHENVLNMDGLGSWQDKQWEITWKNSQLESTQFGSWKQSQVAALSVSTTNFALAHFCLSKNQQTSFCGAISAQDYQFWNGKMTFTQIPIEMFNQYLPPQFASTAVNLNGQGDFSYAPSTGALLQFNADGKNGVISGIKVEGVEKPITFSRFSFDLSNKEQQLQGKMTVDIGDTGNVSIMLSFLDWNKLSMPELDQKIKGNVVINLNNLSLLTVISDQIKEPLGQWHSDITIGGTLGAPILLGESKLTASSLTVVRLGLKLKDVNFTAKSNEKRVVNISGTAKSGEGSININGYFNDYRETETTGMIKITGKDFEMAHIPEALIIGSPELSLSFDQSAVNLSGDVLINEADLKIFTPVKTIAPSPDVVIVSTKEPEPKQSTLKLLSKIRIILGKKVKVQGLGFNGGLEGSVLLDDTRTVSTASGEIHILNGKYAAYGTELDISDGTLSFTGGAIDNPLINIRAQKQLSDAITVGLVVEGTAKSPKVSLFSQPAMEDSDILSYLLIGSPLSGASKQQGQMLANAAASLGLIGGEKLAKKIGEKFGLDEIKLQTDKTTQETSLLLGKYLSPDFFIGYAIGIGNTVDTLQIQYKLTDQWMLKTQSGQSKKAEILFSIEKD